MSYFPFFVEIGQKPCLVVGGGVVALRKVEKLYPFGTEITVVSPAFCRELEALEGIRRVSRKFRKEDIEGMAFVIGATDEEAVNAEIAALCKEKNIPVNIVDDKEKCTFFFPALVKRGEFVAGFTSGGGSPLAAQYIRRQVEESIPQGFENTIAVLSALRERVKGEIADSREREKVFRALFALALEKEGHVTEEEIQAILTGERNGHEGSYQNRQPQE